LIAVGNVAILALTLPGFSHHSRSLLTHRDVDRFPSTTLFDRIARTVCEAECLPRKELFESWEVARRVRRRIRGGRIVDAACGHALTASILILLDDSSDLAVAVDAKLPATATRLRDALASAWPRLKDRVELVEAALEKVPVHAGDTVVSTHACGALTDRVLDRAIAAHANVAVLPCCQSVRTSDVGGLQGWMDEALAIDATRAARLRGAGYEVLTQTIPESITPKNRLLLGQVR